MTIRLRVFLLRVTPRDRAANHVRQLHQIIPLRILYFDLADHACIAFGVIDSPPQITAKLTPKFPPAAAVNHHRRVVQVRLGIFKHQPAGVFVKRFLELETRARQLRLLITMLK